MHVISNKSYCLDVVYLHIINSEYHSVMSFSSFTVKKLESSGVKDRSP